METQKKIREMEIDNDMKIEVVENAFMLMVKYNIQGSYSRNYINLSDFYLRLDLNKKFSNIIEKNTGTASSKGAIWDEVY